MSSKPTGFSVPLASQELMLSRESGESRGSSGSKSASLTGTAPDATPVMPTVALFILLVLPACLLGVGAILADGKARIWLTVGWSVELIGALWWAFGSPLAQRSRFLPVGVFSLVAAIWLAVGPEDPIGTWFVPLCHALLLIGPASLLAREFQARAGLNELALARRSLRRLYRRAEWPDEPAKIRSLPEVCDLRTACWADSAGAWQLLTANRLSLRLAGLAALEFRRYWLPGRAEWVYRLFQLSEHPTERAFALRALGGLEEPVVLDLCRRLMRDPTAELRVAALEVVMLKAQSHWGRYRDAIHALLSDPRFADDRPVGETTGALPGAAILDLTAWAGEPGVVSLRATMALIGYYKRLLRSRASPEMVESLRLRLFDPKTPSVVRVELAHLLRSEDCLDAETNAELLRSKHPSGLRLLAAESLLRENPRHAKATKVLREVARRPNRELALTVARIVQKYLQIDLGLPWGGQKPPSPYSAEAAEVTRRVMAWANQAEAKPVGDRPPGTTSWAIEVPPESTPRARPDVSEWEF